jgi:hypothetical protein
MGIPEEDRSKFPVWTANDLADELDRLAGLLDTANGARSQAGQNVPDFKGVYADKYHQDLSAHVTQVGDTIAQFRRTAGALRDAIEQYHATRRQELGAA